MKSDTLSDTMRIKEELIAQITKKSKTEYLISFWYSNKRYRYSNGRAIGLDLSPNLFPVKERVRQAEVLCSAFTMAIREGWRPVEVEERMSIGSVADRSLKRKLKLDYSVSYKKDLAYVKRLWDEYISKKRLEERPIDDLTIEHIRDWVYLYAPSPASMANFKRTISALLKEELESNGVVLNFGRIKLPKAPQQLHKPIDDMGALLRDIRAFNGNLYLCCLMTYTMLLRPHREVRCLSFGDFNKDFTQVSLSGDKVKSKRNRVLPVPQVVRQEVINRYQGDRVANVFTQQELRYNRDYFKTLWSRYKKGSHILLEDQTLYSFRHTGAIQVFEKTGSLQKLQQVMGHSDMKVSLTYLRGLEVKQMEMEDMPTIGA